MKLSPRRFPDTITRRRTGAATTNAFGEYVPGMTVETEFRANVQPLGVEDSDLVGGTQLSDRRVVYIPKRDALVAAFDDREADRVLVDGLDFVVTDSWTWRTHTKAHVLREP